MSNSFWIVELSVRPELTLGTGERFSREEFLAWAWQQWGDSGLQGIHEGTMLCDEAAEAGFETESWLVDSGEAPRGRDWVGSQSEEHPQLYFESEEAARDAAHLLAQVSGCAVVRIFEQPHQDWDAEWKKSFRGVTVPPDWQILPPWELESEDAKNAPPGSVLVLNPGAGFGTGTHETTQLCLQAFAEFLNAGGKGSTVLDFGSGSGILAIGAALRGARVVHAVEIDPLAIDNARENARLNSVETKIRYETELSGLREVEPREGYDVVFANILRPVLLEFAEALCRRVREGGAMILSGLIETDVASVSERYSVLLGGVQPQVFARAEWRAIVFSRASRAR